jgi:Ca2+-binding EF-hand superfamily protein
MSSDGYKQFFTEADTDGSGYLTLEELIAVLRKKGYKDSDAKIRGMFNAVDTSGDNKVSLEEYLVAMGAMPQKDHKSAAMRSCFRSFDKNGDGKIDSAELDQVFREMGKVLPKEDLDRIIQLSDKDHSGALDYEEFIAQVFGK